MPHLNFTLQLDWILGRRALLTRPRQGQASRLLLAATARRTTHMPGSVYIQERWSIPPSYKARLKERQAGFNPSPLLFWLLRQTPCWCQRRLGDPDPVDTSKVFDDLGQLGCPTERIPWDEWAALWNNKRAGAQGGPGNATVDLLRSGMPSVDFLKGIVVLNNAQTRPFRAIVERPKVDIVLLETYARHWFARGWLPRHCRASQSGHCPPGDIRPSLLLVAARRAIAERPKVDIVLLETYARHWSARGWLPRPPTRLTAWAIRSGITQSQPLAEDAGSSPASGVISRPAIPATAFTASSLAALRSHRIRRFAHACVDSVS
ncbi:nonribosomal peptide synthetase 10 [Teratosphaeria destructans]|uniref:Nonribosomal peptide synthetase 10 n=1 Tax=Teratosphaeria destructans TaxID=418781 RepID=A0A9W7SPT2_9PEZI|nr:nonribosomal peptide synthetase 10 [Teratosphaeria destructans]